jgi:hypothetical protein
MRLSLFIGLILLLVVMTGCSDELFLISSTNPTACPSGAYCEYPAYTYGLSVLNYSDSNDTIVVMRYES